MKQHVFAILIVLVAAGVVGTAAANEECTCPDVLPCDLVPEADLIAGQNIYVGDVYVWNDKDCLYVWYEITADDWYLTETHLDVQCELDDIPQTKKNNPIPGQFAYADSYAMTDMETSACYAIPIQNCDETLFIAAHAVVFNVIGDGCENPIWATHVIESNQGTLVGGGVITDAARTDPEEALREPDASTSAPATGFFSLGFDGNLTLAFDYPIFNGPGVDFVVYETTWGSYPIEAAEVYFDGVSGGVVTNEGSGVGSVSIPDVLSTSNYVKLEDVTQKSDFLSKPNADGYDVDAVGACYLYAGEETAWGDGTEFVGKNWATYITYTVRCCDNTGLVNGGFEYPVVNTDEGWDIFPSGTLGLGWTVEWADSYDDAPDPANLELHQSGVISGVSAPEGGQYAELDTDWDGPGGSLNNEPASVRIYQDLNTCPGEEYTLAFAWKARDGDSEMKVYWGDDEFGPYSVTSSIWNTESLSVTADGWTTRLAFVETGTANSFGMFLDNVSVELV
jgi:hypothetical protein